MAAFFLGAEHALLNQFSSFFDYRLPLLNEERATQLTIDYIDFVHVIDLSIDFTIMALI